MLPTIEVKVGELLVDAIVRIGFAKSKREARYFITHGAVRLGRQVVPDNGELLTDKNQPRSQD